MSGAQAETVSTTPTLTSTYSRTDAHGREISPVPLSDTPGGGGGLLVKHSSQYPSHAILGNTANAVTVVQASQSSRGVTKHAEWEPDLGLAA